MIPTFPVPPPVAAIVLRVGVIDSGWDRSIDEPRVRPGVALVGDSVEDAPRISPDDHDRLGHGTSCTDLLLQVAPHVEVVPVRVFGSALDTTPAVLIAAIDWAVARGIRLLNLSLATSRWDALKPVYAACERARRAGTIIVAAAGRRRGRQFPAVFAPVIGVAAGAVADRFAVKYARDAAVECEASGVQQARGLGGRIVTCFGSSVATPVVTGYVANFLRAYPGADLETVRNALAAASAA